jgi:hypothetical protein
VNGRPTTPFRHGRLEQNESYASQYGCDPLYIADSWMRSALDSPMTRRGSCECR